ncbi:cytochrome c [Fulvivirga ligni]|uniref:cytochrome c n=1 Tax=Fulvivirga ligni TaxID=2904246 RepID=UPI001F3AAF58|nr:cytochrome c [Fulvivirga ligni]UII19957.1 cytochrome c [Fulvivirga ligni]
MRILTVIILLTLNVTVLSAQKADNSTAKKINYYEVQTDKTITTDHGSVLKGKKLFSNHCAECHEFCGQKTGPSLSSVTDRRPLAWLLAFVSSSQTVIQGGDDYAQHLYKSYNNTVMPDFKFLKDEDILDILAYIKDTSSAPNQVAGVNTSASASNEISKHEANLNTEPTKAQKEQGERYDKKESGFKIGMGILVIFVLSLAGIIVYTIWRHTGKAKQ